VGEVDACTWLKKKGIRKLGACDPDEDTESGTFEYHIKKVEQHFWKERFKVYDAWKKSWFEQYQQEGGFLTLTGFWLDGVMNKKDVINYPIQGSAFHCLLWSLIQLTKKLQKWKSKIVGQIHDSVIADVHIDELDAYLKLAKSVMTDRLREAFPWIIVPIEIEAEACGLNETWFDKKEIKL
jgi:hypothetical protein